MELDPITNGTREEKTTCGFPRVAYVGRPNQQDADDGVQRIINSQYQRQHGNYYYANDDCLLLER